MKKLRIVDTYLKCGLRFFIFSQEMPKNFKKLTKKVAKKAQKLGACFHALCAHPRM